MTFMLLVALATGGYSQTDQVHTRVFSRDNGEMVMLCEFTTQATSSKTWRAISSGEGLSRWAAAGAWVELKIGGPYELYFFPEREKGKRGMEGNKVLSFNTDSMISYSGGLPDTWVIYQIEDKGDVRKVSFYGIGTHPEWIAKCSQQAPSVGAFIQKLADYLKS